MSLDEEQLRERFAQRVRPFVFRRAKPEANPATILLGGQPGAGKSRAGEIAAEQAGGHVVAIVGDDYRRFHPDYERVMREDPLRMPDVTAQASGRWIQMCVEHAHRQGYSTLVEGTWRNAQVPLEGAREARAAGRRVDAVVVAVQPEVSRLGAMERYYRDVMAGDDARWTPPKAHDAAADSLPGTVEAVALSSDVDSLRVTNRQGETLFFDDGPPSPERAEGAVAALREGMSRPLAREELRRYETGVQQMSAAHERYTSSDADAREAWEQIKSHDLPLMRGRSVHASTQAAFPHDVLDAARTTGTGQDQRRSTSLQHRPRGPRQEGPEL